MQISTFCVGWVAYQGFHEAGFQSALRKYSNGLEPGMSREEVERRLLGSGASFRKLRDSDQIEIGHKGCWSDDPSTMYAIALYKPDSAFSKPVSANVFERIYIYRAPLDCF